MTYFIGRKTHDLNKFELFRHFILFYNKFDGTLQIAYVLN